MADRKQVTVLLDGPKAWNQWRERNRGAEINLQRANLRGADLQGAMLHESDLTEANLFSANLSHANFFGSSLRRAELPVANARHANFRCAKLDGADLRRANLVQANFQHASFDSGNLDFAEMTHSDLSLGNFCGATFRETNLTGADLGGAKFDKADFSGANLSSARLVETELKGANLSQVDLTRASLIRTKLQLADISGSRVYGTSVWDVDLTNTVQENLIITPLDELTIQVDRLDVAQFIYLLSNNAGIRHVIDTITSKIVLILGRFTEERKVVLNALRMAIRCHSYLPVLFDWEKPTNRDLTETVSTLAHMARFVIADITDAKSIPQELMAIVPNLPSVPVQPILLVSQHEYGMFEHFKRYAWVLPVALYETQVELLRTLDENIIQPAERRLQGSL